MKIKIEVLLFLMFSFFSVPVTAVNQVTVTGTTSPVSGSQYSTLAAAFSAIGTTQSGKDIIITLSGSTTEPASGAVLGAGTWNSLKIYPTVSGVVITNDLISSAPLITLNGADNVTIDGRVNQAGVANMIIDRVSTSGVGSMSIGGTNTGYTSAPTVTISAPTGTGTLVTATATATISGGKVTGFTITNSGSGYLISPAPTVTLTGGGFTAAATATAALATTHTIDFEKNAEGNTIQYCILKGNSVSTKAIVWFGSGVTPSNTYGNGNNTIQNNLFTGNASGRPLYCMYSAGESAYPTVGNKILNNEFKDFLYQKMNTSSLSPVGLYVTGSNPAPSGNNAWTITGNSFYDTGLTPTGATGFTAMQIGSSGNPAGTGYIISDNFIGGSAKECGGTPWTKTGEFDNPFVGIYLVLTTGGTTNSVQNNTIKNISWTNSAGTANTYTIWKGIEIIAGDVNLGTVTGNSIGDNTSTGSITYTTSTPGTNVNGIYINNSAGIVDCQNNKIGSITANNTVGKTDLVGIFKSANGGTTIISKNIIGSTSIAGSLNSINNVTAQAVTGILCSGTGSNTISGNVIANLANATPTSTTNQGIMGIRIGGGTNTVNGNFITSFSTPNSTSANLYGINITAGTGTYSNNIISLGSNNLNTIYGIYETGSATQNNNLYFNTVHIGGSPTSGTLKSYCLYSAVNTNSRDFRNNIFSNVRSNASGSNIHYPIWINTTGGTLICDNNDYFTSGIGGTLGYYGGNKTALPVVSGVTGNDANSKIDNPVFANAGGTTAVDLITSLTATTLIGVAGTGITTDFAGSTRYSTPKMGAYESSFISSDVNIDGLSLAAGSSLTVLNGAHLNINASTELNNMTIQGGGKVTNVSSLTASNFIINSDATNGTGTYLDNGTTNATTVIVNQYLTPARNWYISSPVGSASSGGIKTTTGNTLVSYNETTGTWSDAPSSMEIMNGYIATSPIAESTIAFTGGALNTGDKSINVSRLGTTKPGFNLVGNPYPSYLDWNAAVTNPATTNLGTSIWYRTKVSGSYAFATYNSGGQFTNGGTRYIPPMQAFWVRVAENQTAGTLSVTNNMRSHESGTNRLKAPTPANSLQKVLRLEIFNGTNTDETVVYFNQNANNNLDAYDSYKMSNGNPVPDIYTLIGAEKLAINGFKSLITNMELPVGFATGSYNNLTIKATEISNFDAETKIMLKDNLLNTEQELTIGRDYSFSSEVTGSTTRFSLIFKSAFSSTGINNRETDKLTITVYKNPNGQLTINHNLITGKEGTIIVFNAMGQKLVNTPTTGSSTILSKPLNFGIYFVTVNISGKSITKKVIIN